MTEEVKDDGKSLAFLEKSKNIKIIIILFIFTVGFSYLLASKYFQNGNFQVHDSIFDFQKSSGVIDLDAINTEK